MKLIKSEINFTIFGDAESKFAINFHVSLLLMVKCKVFY